VSVDREMLLSQQAAADLEEAHAAAVDQILNRESRLPNVVGVAVGKKWTNGQPTKEAAVLVLVTHKVKPAKALPSAAQIPVRVPDTDTRTDVYTVGHLFAGQRQPQPAPHYGSQIIQQNMPPMPDLYAAPAAAPARPARFRPAKGGHSVGHIAVTAGTIATAVYDFLPDATATPPVSGIGVPGRFYLLSNNHVLANSNDAAIGDPILQPGPFDGGTDPVDRIGSLTRYIPLELEPDIPRDQHDNLVDAAIAEARFDDIDREVRWIGKLRAWQPRAKVTVGTLVQKTGRTTNYTVGRITAVNATVDVGYGGGRVARLRDQILTTNMSAPGDSGSLVSTLSGEAVGLLCAGSPQATVANQIEYVRSLLRVEVAELMEE
jgi:hypothetical protein